MLRDVAAGSRRRSAARAAGRRPPSRRRRTRAACAAHRGERPRCPESEAPRRVGVEEDLREGELLLAAELVRVRGEMGGQLGVGRRRELSAILGDELQLLPHPAAHDCVVLVEPARERLAIQHLLADPLFDEPFELAPRRRTLPAALEGRASATIRPPARPGGRAARSRGPPHTGTGEEERRAEREEMDERLAQRAASRARACTRSATCRRARASSSACRAGASRRSAWRRRRSSAASGSRSRARSRTRAARRRSPGPSRPRSARARRSCWSRSRSRRRRCCRPAAACRPRRACGRRDHATS